MKLPMAAATAVTDGEWWTASAMTQDALVADLLLRIRHSTKHQATRPSFSGKLAADLAQAGWGVRQPRSAATIVGSRSVTPVTTVSESRRSRNRKEKTGRRSPSTPLSWSGGSGGGGGSGGVDGCEASSSRSLNRSPNSRSKPTSLAASEVNAASSSKARKKKTYAELREEEGMLLQERIYLNQELAVLGATVKEQRAENESLKRIKLDLSTPLMKNPSCSAAPAQSKKAMTKASAHGLSSSSASHQPSPSPMSCKAESAMSSPTQARAVFGLPDLNMMPSEPDSTTS